MELKKWHDEIAGYVLQIPGVILTDIDESKNRITIGIENQDVKVEVEKKLTEFNIPLEAVNIIVSGPIVPL